MHLLRAAAVVVGVMLIGTVARAYGLPGERRSGTVVTGSAVAAAPLTLAASATEFVAAQATESGEATPPFDALELRRQAGATVSTCGSFGRPAIMDNGAARHWIYRLPRQAAGACGVASGGRFFAVGTKGTTQTTSQLTP